MHCHPRPCPISPSPQVLKVGFGLSGDLSKLAGSWPGSRCWQEVGPTLDLLPLWVAAGLRAKVGTSDMPCMVCCVAGWLVQQHMLWDACSATAPSWPIQSTCCRAEQDSLQCIH